MSRLAWIDFDESEHQRMRRLIGFFNERDSRDELGLGAIRDCIAGQLFPGTSTIHTRLRYVLFVPWIFKMLESRKATVPQLIAAARAEEIQLIKALAQGNEREGVIGYEAREKLQRLPSSVYWSCLASWGIRLHQGSIDNYFASIPARRRRLEQARDAEAESIAQHAWHAALPPAPATLLTDTRFDLSETEAGFLVDRLVERHPASLLSLLAREHRHAECDYVWEHPDFSVFPQAIRRLVDHGRIVSRVMHGAALLYNLMLSELCAKDDRIGDYHERLRDWEHECRPHLAEIRDWLIDDLWKAMADAGSPPHDQLKTFVEAWRRIAVDCNGAVADSDQARALVRTREESLKKHQSRFTNTSLRNDWQGEAGTARMTFRWPQANRHLKDIANAR